MDSFCRKSSLFERACRFCHLARKCNSLEVFRSKVEVAKFTNQRKRHSASSIKFEKKFTMNVSHHQPLNILPQSLLSRAMLSTPPSTMSKTVSSDYIANHMSKAKLPPLTVQPLVQAETDLLRSIRLDMLARAMASPANRIPPMVAQEKKRGAFKKLSQVKHAVLRPSKHLQYGNKRVGSKARPMGPPPSLVSLQQWESMKPRSKLPSKLSSKP